LRNSTDGEFIMTDNINQTRFHSFLTFPRGDGTHSYIFRHLTWKRLVNFITVKIEKRFRRSRLRGLPYKIIVDTCNVCNFHCPLCRTGARLNGRKKGMMSFANFKRFIDPLAEHALVLILHNWGEPFLNKDIYKMIAYANSKGLATRLSSNLYAMDRQDLKNVVDSGLNHITVSIDGASEETYTKYRVGGDFRRVLDNLKILIEIKRQYRRPFPVIEWQFLVMRHNEHEIPDARRLAGEIGVDLLTFGPIGFGEAPYDGSYDNGLGEKWLPRHNLEYRYRYDGAYLFDTPCFFLWESVTLNRDGGLAPCCVLDDPRMDFGNVMDESVQNIWNNELYIGSRREFNPRLQGKSECQTACWRCKIYRKR
jgi:MoaA/NifB/PqqE/SkfB family radical SAM enzyme